MIICIEKQRGINIDDVHPKIYFSTTLIPSYTQKRLYAKNQTTDAFEWISSETYNAGGYAQPIYKEVSAVPNFDNDEAEEYAKWLKVQYDMYDLLTKDEVELREFGQNAKRWIIENKNPLIQGKKIVDLLEQI